MSESNAQSRPVISVAIRPRTNDDRENLKRVLHDLTQEDPTMRIETEPTGGEIIVAIFAKPLTPGGRKRQQEVINGFQIAGGILLGWVLVKAKGPIPHDSAPEPTCDVLVAIW